MMTFRPYQPLNLGNLILQSYAAPKMTSEAMLSAQLQNAASKLANQKMQAESPYWGDMSAADLAYKQAQTPYLNAQIKDILTGRIPLEQAQAAQEQFYNKNPLLKQGGTAGQIGALTYLQDLENRGKNPYADNLAINTSDPKKIAQLQAATGGIVDPSYPTQAQSNVAAPPLPGKASQKLSDLLLQSLNSQQGLNQSRTERNNALTQAMAWTSLPAPEKEDLIASAVGAGYTRDEASKLFSQGKSLNELYQQKGVDASNPPDKIFAITGATKNQFQRSMVANAELSYLGPRVSAWMAPYVQTFKGYSPSQIADALKGQHKDTQIKYLAAHMLAPELSSLRIKTQGGTVGVTFNEEMQDKALTNGKVFASLVTPEVYQAANDLVEKTLTEGGNFGRQMASKGGITLSDEDLAKGAPENSIFSNQGNNVSNTNFGANISPVRMIRPDGKEVMVHPEDVSEALSKKYRRK